jgi:tetratricopeptide (TPR) repeat protein
LASAALSEGDTNKAITVHKQIQTEFEQLNNKDKTDAYVLDKVFSSYSNLASIYHYQGLIKQTFEHVYQALILLELAIKQDPNNKGWQGSLFHHKVMLMVINAQLHDTRVSYSPEILMQELNKKKDEFDGKQNYLRVQSNLLLESARYYQIIGQSEKSADFTAQALALYHEFYTVEPDNSRLVLALAETELLQAMHYKTQLQDKESQQSCARAKRLLEPLQLKDKRPHYIQPYARALSCLNELEQHPELQQLLQKSDIVLTTF